MIGVLFFFFLVQLLGRGFTIPFYQKFLNCNTGHNLAQRALIDIHMCFYEP